MSSDKNKSGKKQARPEFNDEVESLIVHQRYGVDYQPIVNLKSGEIIGFEALARFYAPDGHLLQPRSVFATLHADQSQLIQVEYELKKLQIDYAPDGYALFLNLDPHAIRSIIDLENDALIRFLCGCQNIIIEFIENIDIHDARACTSLHEYFKDKHIATALDDIGAVNTLISLELFAMVDYLKFDRSWFSLLSNDIYRELFVSMTSFARNINKPMILEGIEDEDMLEAAREFSIDHIQGYLYRKMFRSYNP